MKNQQFRENSAKKLQIAGRRPASSRGRTASPMGGGEGELRNWQNLANVGKVSPIAPTAGGREVLG